MKVGSKLIRGSLGFDAVEEFLAEGGKADRSTVIGLTFGRLSEEKIEIGSVDILPIISIMTSEDGEDLLLLGAMGKILEDGILSGFMFINWHDDLEKEVFDIAGGDFARFEIFDDGLSLFRSDLSIAIGDGVDFLTISEIENNFVLLLFIWGNWQ